MLEREKNPGTGGFFSFHMFLTNFLVKFNKNYSITFYSVHSKKMSN